ncbi:MAG: tail fiber domain-containing protein [Porphyromonadaceae bacterium]|nr:MAG: tail fiber domain-containing protein [Porphyromonadaceae bacterium]
MKTIQKINFSIFLLIFLSTPGFTQMRVWNNTTESVNGQVLIGDFTSPWDGQLNIKNTTPDKRTLYLQHNASSDGKHCLTINVNRLLSEAWVVMYNGAAKSFARGNGNIYSNGVLLTSDSTLKRDIKPLLSVKKQLFMLNGYSYYRKDDGGLLPKREIGFLAQEVEKVFPETVDTAFGGKKVLSYTSMIPIIVEAMKEQQTEIEQLKGQISNLSDRLESLEKKFEKGGLAPAPQNNTAAANPEQSNLFQNTPNPFSESTTIRYSLPLACSTARLIIFDSQGIEKKNFLIVSRGVSETIINARELNPGTYVYTLVVDGRSVDTKTMILTAN